MAMAFWMCAIFYCYGSSWDSSEAIMKINYIKLLSLLVLCAWTLLSGCTSVNTFPSIARPGDTVSLMIGGSEKANKNSVSATFTDATGRSWDLKALGLVRSVFNLRTDGRANGAHYSSYQDSYVSWAFGHEPLQTVLVTDLPMAVAPGQGNLTISVNANDNSSGVADPFNVKLEIIPGTGMVDQFLNRRSSGNVPADFGRLETAPNAKVTFGSGTTFIGAASLVVSFNPAIVNPKDLNIYVPESTVRGSGTTVSFGKTQRMVYWHQDGTKLYVDIIAPQGINPRYLQFFVVYPTGLIGSPAFSILSAQVYGTDGNAIAVTPTLSYLP
jgi:hypothetical protein